MRIYALPIDYDGLGFAVFASLTVACLAVMCLTFFGASLLWILGGNRALDMRILSRACLLALALFAAGALVFVVSMLRVE